MVGQQEVSPKEEEKRKLRNAYETYRRTEWMLQEHLGFKCSGQEGYIYIRVEREKEIRFKWK